MILGYVTGISLQFFFLVFELKKIFRTKSDDYKIIKVCSNEFLCFVLLCSSQSFSWGFLMDFFLCGTSSIAFVIVNRVSVTNRNEEPIEDQSISSKDFIGRSKNRCPKFISQSTFERIGKYTDEYYEILLFNDQIIENSRFSSDIFRAVIAINCGHIATVNLQCSLLRIIHIHRHILGIKQKSVQFVCRE